MNAAHLLTVAGAAQAHRTPLAPCSLLPVELRHVNHTASTNVRILSPNIDVQPTIASRMAHPDQHPIDQIADRVERLLVRHQELQRTNDLLNNQLAQLTRERDSLKARLSAARARVDALLERLPPHPSEAPEDRQA
jgi:uncharacterized protein (TIGR02449 family)